MFVVKDRVKQGTTTQGTGNVTVSTSYAGFQNFSVLGNGSKTFYAIEESTNWEVGIGTYNSNVISRDTIIASSSGAGNPIHLSGAATIFVTYPADNSVFTTGDIASITGVKLGASGIAFSDGTTQTTAVGSTPTFDDIYINEYIYHNGDTNTYIRFRGDQIDFVAGNRTMLTLDEANNDKVIFNNGGNDINFRVESKNEQYLIFTDGNNNKVGIRTNSPSYQLDVDGSGNFSSGVRFPDGGLQEIAFTPTSGAKIDLNTSRVTSIMTTGVATASNLASTGATNAAAASTNSTNITSVGNRVTAIEGSGVATSASVTSVSNRVSTIEGSGVALESDLTSAENRISTIEGSGLATTANLASTGATNAAAIAAITPFSATSGALITTIQSTGVATAANLIATGVNLEPRIKTIEGSGVATSSSVTAVSNRVTTIEGSGVATAANLIATGVNLEPRIKTIEGSGVATAANLAATGATNAAAIDSIVAFSPASGAKVDLNTTNITSTGDTLKAQLIATGNDLEAQIGAATVPTATGVKIDNNSSSITTIQGSGVALTGSVVSLASSGVGYSNRITTIEGSGVATSSSVTAVSNRVTTIEGSGVATASNLIATGVNLEPRIKTIEGSGVATAANLIATGVNLEPRIKTIEGSGVATAANLIATGVNLEPRIKTIEGSGVALSGSVESLASSGITGPIMVSGSPNLVQSFDLSQGNFHTVLMTGNMTGIIPHNAVAKQSFAIRFVQDNTGSRTMTNWFTNGAGVIHTTKFAGGSAFTLTTTANKSDVFGFICDTSGTYEAFIIGQNV